MKALSGKWIFYSNAPCLGGDAPKCGGSIMSGMKCALLSSSQNKNGLKMRKCSILHHTFMLPYVNLIIDSLTYLF